MSGQINGSLLPLCFITHSMKQLLCCLAGLNFCFSLFSFFLFIVPLILHISKGKIFHIYDVKQAGLCPRATRNTLGLSKTTEMEMPLGRGSVVGHHRGLVGGKNQTPSGQFADCKASEAYIYTYKMSLNCYLLPLSYGV